MIGNKKEDTPIPKKKQPFSGRTEDVRVLIKKKHTSPNPEAVIEVHRGQPKTIDGIDHLDGIAKMLGYQASEVDELLATLQKGVVGPPYHEELIQFRFKDNVITSGKDHIETSILCPGSGSGFGFGSGKKQGASSGTGFNGGPNRSMNSQGSSLLKSSINHQSGKFVSNKGLPNSKKGGPAQIKSLSNSLKTNLPQNVAAERKKVVDAVNAAILKQSLGNKYK